jgi:hypothetical protein
VDGARGLFELVPLTPTAVDAMALTLRAAGLLALLGVWTRAALTTLFVSFGYLSAAAQCEGAAFHDMHLTWMLALLLVSPCGEALSLDRWARGGGLLGPAPDRAAGACVLAARALLAGVYFFPGLWKVRTSGLAWVLGDNLRNQLWCKWFEHGYLPTLRVDRLPALCSLGALGVLTLELSFPALVLFARGRLLAMLGGMAFHSLSAVFLAIHFPSLLVCYPVLLDGEALRERVASWWPAGALETLAIERHPGAPWAVGGTLVLAVVVQGARGDTQAWPVACYPTFEYIAPDTLEDLAAELELSDGRVSWLRAPRARPQGAWGLTWRMLGHYGGASDPAALRAWAEATARAQGRTRTLAQARAVRFWAERYSVDPERAREGPVARRRLGL